MTPSSDGWGDMRDDGQILDDPLLTDFLSGLRAWGTETPVPSAALATLLDDAGPSPHLDPVPPPIRRKQMLVAKLAGLGLAAKVALGAGVAAAAVTTAGVANVLPDQAKHGVASIVNAVSPIDIPDIPSQIGLDVDGEVDVTIPTTTLPGAIGGIDDDLTGDDTADDEAPANHGACVSAVARDRGLQGREHGQAVSAIAQSDCGKEDETATSTTTTSTTLPEGLSAESGPSQNSGPGNSGNHGQGAGNGNSGSGNPGKG